MSVPIVKTTRRCAAALRRSIRARGARINPRPIVVYGLQKSGTTAIAALLGELTGLSVSLDLEREIGRPSVHRVRSGELSVDRFVRNHRLEFSRDIVKEPSLTPLFDLIDAAFPEARNIIVVRDPRQNIRSILNRLGIAGDLAALPDEAANRVPPAWRLVMDSRWLGLENDQYIASLARRWVHSADVYFDHSDRLRLVRYEDFVADKAAAIRALAGDLDLPPVHDISDRVDVQFQPAGNRRITPEAFFGDANLSTIESICAARMADLGYAGGALGVES